MRSHFLPLHIVFPKFEKERLVEVLLNNLAKYDYLSHAHVMHKEGTVGLCLYYNEDKVTQAELTKIVCDSGAAVVDNYVNQSFVIKNMHSTDCARLIETSLSSIDGVYNAAVTYSGSRLVVEYDGLKISYATIKSLLLGLGYDISRVNFSLGFMQKNRELFFSLISGLTLVWSWFLHANFDGNTWYIAMYLSYFFGSFYTLRHCINALRYLQLDIDLLMIVAAFGAAFIGKWFEGALLLFLFSLGHALEHKAMHKARAAVSNLASGTPKSAFVRRGDDFKSIAIDKIVVNDFVLVKPNQAIPCDGVIIYGSSAINESSITGESIPVNKVPGESVFAGTLNGDSALTIKVTKKYNDSTLAKMIEMILDADAKKSNAQTFTEKFESYFVPLVFITVALMLILPCCYLGEDFFSSFYKSILILVAASPCALAIGTPAAVLSAVARSAKFGVLIKGGKHLERFATIKTLAMDKTGTITTGIPVLSKIRILDDLSESEVLKYAASIEQSCNHPISRALINATTERNIKLSSADNVTELPGRGILGFIDKHEVVVGNLNAFGSVSNQIKSIFYELQKDGSTTMLVAIDGIFKGVIAVNDEERSGIREIIEKLQKLGIKKTVMLTGDNNNAAANIAKKVGISDFISDLLPEDKVNKVSELENDNAGNVAMLGDGVNDAPAMAKALLGIAMGGAGSDIALESADIVLMKDDISALPRAFSLSKQADRVIKQNIALALFSIVALVIASLAELLNLSTVVFLHESTSIVVVLNGLRLLKFKPSL